MKNNYPIKYALVPMIEQVGWAMGLNELEREYDNVCYIVSKCYIINEIKEYKENGLVETKYNVVCPYEYHKILNYWEREFPKFNYVNNYCTNSITVDNVYDTKEEAKEAKQIRNMEILNHQLSYIAVNSEYEEKVKKLKNVFNNKLKYYEQLEEFIEMSTPDLVVNGKIKEQNVIIYKENEYKEYNRSLYTILDLYDSNFIVYSLTQSDYDNLKENLDKNIDIKKYNYSPLLINYSEKKMKKIMSNNGDVKYIDNNNDLIEKYIYKNETIVPDNGSINFKDDFNYDMVIYTIEDYNDIIYSYKLNNNKCKRLTYK